jgi:hypothetical protein
MEVLADIYRNHASVSLELYQRFTNAEKGNAQYKYGTHSYRLEDFGLTKEDVEKKMEFYSSFVRTLSK